MKQIGRLQSLFDHHRVQPVYVVAYPIASQPLAFMPLRRFVEQGRASVGAHLHPWVTPPYSEELTRRNSYGGNLNEELELAKLSVLTDRIQQSFGFRPTVYKAGRYGIGPNTFRILSQLGYAIDMSMAPPLDCSGDGGPDFSRVSYQPFRDEDTGIMVIPTTGSFQGWWPGDHARLHKRATTSWRARLRMNAILNRSRAVQRLWLTPETFAVSEMIRLTRRLLKRGNRSFVLSLHSPIVMPGATPFAKNEQEVRRLLGRLNEYFEFFFGDLQGQPWTPEAALKYWQDESNLLPSMKNVGRQIAVPSQVR